MKREVLLLGGPALYEVSTAVTREELERILSIRDLRGSYTE